MLRALATLLLASTTLAVAGHAQQDFAAFRQSVEMRLRAHPFFSRVTLTLVEQPPFLFCIERPTVDEKDYEKVVTLGFLPHLQELMQQFEQDYRQPAGLKLRAEAGGYALAVLANAGSYLNFRTAIGDPSLALARAHYTPDLQIAVTYIDAFARQNTKREELHSLLHEFVHALQHAHSSDGTMPKPVWFNEGLADYRSACTHMSASLRQPPLQDNHLRALAFGYAHPGGKLYVAPLVDLVGATSYQQVLELAKKRNGGEVPAGALLGMFYSQAEMFVRFLHEGVGGVHRDAFLRYLQAAQRGEAGLATFLKAFDLQADPELRALDAQFRAWLDEVLRKQYPNLPDLKAGAVAASGVVPMSPPSAFDLAGLGWRAEDFAERVDGARRRCALGDYEGALQMLPTVVDAPADRAEFVARERARVVALLEMRAAALEDLQNGKRQLSFEYGGERKRAKVLGSEGGELIVEIGKEQMRVPLTVMKPVVLKVEAGRLERLKGADKWFEVWTRWLEGESKRRLAGLLKLDYTTMVPLREDLDEELTEGRGEVTAAVVELLQLPQDDDPDVAATALARLQELVRQHGESPLLQRRKPAIDRLAKAYAERAFRVSDPRALEIHGDAKIDAEGRLAVEYRDSGAAPSADFAALKDQEKLPFESPKIAYSGPSGLLPTSGGWKLVGSSWLSWSVPLTGSQTIEVDFVLDGDFVPDFGVGVAAGPGHMMFVMPTGGVQVFDVETQVMDAVGGGAQLIVGKTHKLRIEHDGKKVMRVSVDGKETAAVTDVGRMVSGDLYLGVNSSSAAKIVRLAIRGKPDPHDPQAVRDRYVALVLDELWKR